MPRIKGWKKEFEMKYIIMYRHTSSNKRLCVYRTESSDEWRVRYGFMYRRKEGRLVYYTGGKLLKVFQYKKNALEFAREYMKKHLKG